MSWGHHLDILCGGEAQALVCGGASGQLVCSWLRASALHCSTGVLVHMWQKGRGLYLRKGNRNRNIWKSVCQGVPGVRRTGAFETEGEQILLACGPWTHPYWLFVLEKVKKCSVASSFQNFLLNLPLSNAEMIHLGSQRDLYVYSSQNCLPLAFQKGMPRVPAYQSFYRKV